MAKLRWINLCKMPSKCTKAHIAFQKFSGGGEGNNPNPKYLESGTGEEGWDRKEREGRDPRL